MQCPPSLKDMQALVCRCNTCYLVNWKKTAVKIAIENGDIQFSIVQHSFVREEFDVSKKIIIFMGKNLPKGLG